MPGRRFFNFHTATASVVADTHQEYLVHDRLRNALRALIVVGIFGCVIGFAAGKYATDDSLRQSTVTVREPDYRKLEQDGIKHGLCPCRHDALFWGLFVTYEAPLSEDRGVMALHCDQAIMEQNLSGQKLLAELTAEQRDILAINAGAKEACMSAMLDIVKAFNPNPTSHTIGISDSLRANRLQSFDEARQRIDDFICDKFMHHANQIKAQLQFQQKVLGAQGWRFSYANATSTALDAFEKTTDGMFIKLLQMSLMNATTLNYETYQGECAPLYCDYTKKKGVWSRLTEFLGMIGGLYTTFLAMGITAWFLLDLILPPGFVPDEFLVSNSNGKSEGPC